MVAVDIDVGLLQISSLDIYHGSTATLISKILDAMTWKCISIRPMVDIRAIGMGRIWFNSTPS